jgi:hypothetical protein
VHACMHACMSCMYREGIAVQVTGALVDVKKKRDSIKMFGKTLTNQCVQKLKTSAKFESVVAGIWWQRIWSIKLGACAAADNTTVSNKPFFSL